MMILITMRYLPHISLPEEHRNRRNCRAQGRLAETATKKTLCYPCHKESDSRGSQKVGGDRKRAARNRKQRPVGVLLDNQKPNRDNGEREISIKHVGRADETAERQRGDCSDEESRLGRKELARQNVGHQEEERGKDQVGKAQHGPDLKISVRSDGSLDRRHEHR